MIAKYEVMQEQWEAVMGVGSNPSRSKGEDLPVDTVSWDDLHTSEAQWEYACRAGDERLRNDKTLYKIAWSGGKDWNSHGWLHVVGTKEPNTFGLHDILFARVDAERGRDEYLVCHISFRPLV